MEHSGSRALAIVRVSTSEQAQEERYSIPHQRVHIKEECQLRGLHLVHFFEFVQSGARVLSQKSGERADILKYISDHEINVVMVHELDRLARSMLDTLLFVDQLNKLGVTFISIHDGFDTGTAQGQLQMHILAAFAEYFRKQLASKVTGGMLERAKTGKHMGRLPLGYKAGPAGLEIDDREARTVRLIFSMYLEQNLGLRAIAEQLNGMGLKTHRGRDWSHVSVRQILENEIYTGTYTWSGIRMENNHQPIVGRSAWDRARHRRERKKGLGGRSQNSIFLLSGLVRCGVCGGAAMVGRTSKKTEKYSYRYYVCTNYASRGVSSCPGGYYRADELEESVIADIQNQVHSFRAEVRLDKIPVEAVLPGEMIELKRREMASLNNMLSRAAEAYERGMYDLDWFSVRSLKISRDKVRITEEIKDLEKRLGKKLPPEKISEYIEARVRSPGNLISRSNQVRTKAVLQELIDRIVVCGSGGIKIYYRL